MASARINDAVESKLDENVDISALSDTMIEILRRDEPQNELVLKYDQEKAKQVRPSTPIQGTAPPDDTAETPKNTVDTSLKVDDVSIASRSRDWAEESPSLPADIPAGPSGKKKSFGGKKLQLITESEESKETSPIPGASHVGLYGKEISDPFSAATSRSLNPLTGKITDEQLSGTTVVRNVGEILSLLNGQGELIKLLERKISEQQKTIDEMVIGHQAIKTSYSLLHDRMAEFDEKSLSVVNRAAQIIDKIVPDQEPLVKELKAEKEAASASKTANESSKIAQTVKPKQKTTKMFKFSSI